MMPLCSAFTAADKTDALAAGSIAEMSLQRVGTNVALCCCRMNVPSAGRVKFAICNVHEDKKVKKVCEGSGDETSFGKFRHQCRETKFRLFLAEAYAWVKLRTCTNHVTHTYELHHASYANSHKYAWATVPLKSKNKNPQFTGTNYYVCVCIYLSVCMYVCKYVFIYVCMY